MSQPEKAPNADQLRAAIDSGAAGDKVAFPDPAAAPLGTDAEASGAPPASSERRQAFRAELTDAPGPLPSRDGTLTAVLGFLGLIVVSIILTVLILAGR
jgi:hypothetical protein